MKNVDIVVGLQWGDEGKGRIVDFLSSQYVLTVRFQGGANAGHTVYVNGKRHVFHLLPSGILHESSKVAIGAGVVLDMEVLANELQTIKKEGIDIDNRVFIDKRATIVLPFHKLEDELFEMQENGVGSTKRGIGPAYRDSYYRIALRADNLTNSETMQNILDRQIAFSRTILKQYEHAKMPVKTDILDYINKFAHVVIPLLSDISIMLYEYNRKGKMVLMEGAQGALLDIFLGTYPYVTSSHTISGGALVGTGIGPGNIREVFGVFKAYCTRVGKGPFPTEIKGETGKNIAEIGDEFGATTGRARRVGWLDLPLLKYSVFVNGVTALIMTKLDVLENFSTVKVAVSYNLDGKSFNIISPTRRNLTRAKPVYREFGPFTNVKNAKSRSDFDRGTKEFISFIERETGVPVKFISIGKDRDKLVS